MRTEKVWVLIINFINYRETLRYVRDLQAQQGISLSILVVDNNSPNESYAVLRQELRPFPNTVLLQSHFNGGYAFGVNTGLKYLADKRLDYIFISNNDIRLNEDFLFQQLICKYKKLPEAAFIAPAMFVNGKEDQKHQAWKIPGIIDDLMASLRVLYFLGHFLGISNRYKFRGTDTTEQPVDCISGSFFMGSQKVFRELGLWDENTFLYVEETLLGWKVKMMGKQNYLIRSLSFNHESGGTTRTLHSKARLQKYWLESTIYFHRTYRKAPPWQLVLLRILFRFWLVETFILNLFHKPLRTRPIQHPRH